MDNTANKRRTKAIVYRDGKIGVTRYNSMREIIDTVKQLKHRNIVMGIALFSGAEYQETIPIGGVL